MLVEAGAHGLLVAAANAAAEGFGISPRMRFTDAKANCPKLLHDDIDRGADAAALRALGDWMVRIAPLIAIDGTDGLMMETTGCAHLYGGEADMLAEVSRLLDRDHIPHQVAIAGTPGAAYALAREDAGAILGTGDEATGLANLSTSALRISAEAQTLLRRFGLTRIGQLYDIDRKALARRFRSREAADAVLLRLDQALGVRNEPLTPLRAPPLHTARLNCPEPLQTGEAIRIGLEQLAGELCEELKRLGQGARVFVLRAFRSDGTTSHAEITLARPVSTPDHILRLFDERLARIDPGFGIDLLLLEALRAGAMETGAVALSGDLAASDTDAVALAALADRVTAKLGHGAVSALAPQESYLPERAEVRADFDGNFSAATERAAPARPRPIRMIDPPETIRVLAEVPDGPPQHFVWRRVARRVTRADGPERIGPEWWRYAAPPAIAASPDGTDRKWLSPRLDPRADAQLIEKIRDELEQEDTAEPLRHLPRTRDYYRIEDTEGRRYWVFRKGLYDDGRGGPPEWYVHGLFA